jgi:hypothetical protein
MTSMHRRILGNRVCEQLIPIMFLSHCLATHKAINYKPEASNNGGEYIPGTEGRLRK